jgi:anaerobic magnesium-protoporphyrin IX monomethyl ester cyclase
MFPERMPLKNAKVLLLFPPRWDAIAPYPAIPQLTAYLRSRGVSVKGSDLNAQLLRWMLSPKGTKALVEALQAVVQVTDDFKGQELPYLGTWAGLWIDDIPRDHLRLRKYLVNPDPGTIRDMHAFHVIIQRAWNALEILNAAHRRHPEVPVPHHSFLEGRLKELLAWDPDVVGFSAVTQQQLLTSLECARILRTLGCRAGLAAGGCAVSSAFGSHFHESSLPEEMDCLVVGPGEEALLQLADLMRRGAPWPRILRGHSRKYEISYSPDFCSANKGSQFWTRYSFPYPFSDGCRWRKCRFCGLYCTRRYRASDPDQLLPQLAFLQKEFGCVSFFNIGAELAAGDAARIARALEKKKLRIRWQSMARADRGWTEPLCRRLKKQGFEYIMFGIESLSDPILALMGKGISAQEQINALAAACKSGLKPAVSLIFDFPGEKIRDLETTLEAIEPYVNDLSSLTLLRFHLDRTSIMAANVTNYSIKTKNRIFRSIYRDDIFQIRYQDLQRDRRHLSRALRLFDRWIYSVNLNRSILFTRDFQSVQLGFDLNFFFEGRHPSRERLDDYFAMDAILN